MDQTLSQLRSPMMKIRLILHQVRSPRNLLKAVSSVTMDLQFLKFLNLMSVSLAPLSLAITQRRRRNAEKPHHFNEAAPSISLLVP